MRSWTWALASARGTSHEATRDPCQDASFCCTPSGKPSTLIGVVSDGAGSAACGGLGARVVVRTLVTQIRELLARGGELDDEALRTVLDAARDRIAHVAATRQLAPRDFAATVIAAIANSAGTTVLHIGDGSAVAEDRDGAWHALSWPAHGEYASTTYFVTDDAPQLRITRSELPSRTLVLFTDGLERLALDFAKQEPHSPFFSALAAPVHASAIEGRNRDLSTALASFLGSEKVNARTDDDKTLLVAAMR